MLYEVITRSAVSIGSPVDKEALFRRFVQPALLPDAVKTALLPSTSPAHASLTLAEKLEIWRGIV